MTARSDRHPRTGNLRLLVTMPGCGWYPPALDRASLRSAGAGAPVARRCGTRHATRCEATPGAMYRTHFNVQPDGRVSDAASESGDGCVQQALRTWVTTFSYAPLRTTTPVAFDWMIVTATRSN
ncbi:MAG: hypothetical protein IPF84_16675 [Proteobacteria bacterium]|nr:hypothetical protein [Pseudomonadota bacterium]